MSGLRVVDAYAMKSSGFSRGEGAPLPVGQFKEYPVAWCGFGRTKKLRRQTA